MPNTKNPPNNFDDGFDTSDHLVPLNTQAIPESARLTAVALKDRSAEGLVPALTAAGRGAVAEKILEIAYQNGVNVRQDTDLANLLATFELDSPIPTEALMAVGEILAYIYAANTQGNPFDAILKQELAKQ